MREVLVTLLPAQHVPETVYLEKFILDPSVECSSSQLSHLFGESSRTEHALEQKSSLLVGKQRKGGCRGYIRII